MLATAIIADFFRDRDDLGWEEAMDRLVARPDIIKPQKIPVFLSDKRRNDFVFLLATFPPSDRPGFRVWLGQHLLIRFRTIASRLSQWKQMPGD